VTLPQLPPARLLLVEDHPLYRDGLLAMLRREAGALRCHAVERADSALALLRSQPDIDLVLADHHLPGAMDGMALLEQVGREFPTAARVLVSGSNDAHLAAHARRMGCMGFIPKALEPLPWIAALARILDGEPWFPPTSAPSAEAGITPRQALILERYATGHSSRDIAAELGITERTVKYHLQEVYARLDAGNRAEAVARASARGWIRLPTVG
jgi:two-component system, NarL family, nitrate/nitrite response regulator NarL